MITVTKDEDNYMRRKGLSSKGTLKEKYLDLGIEIIELDKSPYGISKLFNPNLFLRTHNSKQLKLKNS